MASQPTEKQLTFIAELASCTELGAWEEIGKTMGINRVMARRTATATNASDTIDRLLADREERRRA